MPVYIPTNGVEAVEVAFTLMKGEGLAAKDRNLMGQRSTSDPYCVVSLETTVPGVGRAKAKTSTEELGKTKTIMKTLSPEWNQTFSTKISCSALTDPKTPPCIVFHIFDYDKGSDDDSMGVVKIPIKLDPPKSFNKTEWYPVPATSAKNAKGKLQVKIKATIHRSTTLQRGNAFELDTNHIRVGLAWDLVKGKIIDLDAACVAVDTKGNISMDNSVYYGNLSNPNESIVHSGDSRDGNAEGEDESITFRLENVSTRILALYIVLTVASPKRFLSSVTSARVTITDEAKANEGPMASFVPSKHVDSEDATALFLVRIARESKTKWKVQPIEDVHQSARDFGSLIPHFKSYSRDLIPSIVVNPQEKISVMRKGGTIKIRDFCPDKVLPDNVTFGLSWDMAGAGDTKVDLDASAICLDSDLKCVDKVWFKHLASDDTAIRHGGDQRSGEDSGDDERLYVQLSKVAKKTTYIGFVVNSYSGQELDDIKRASCHLFDTMTGVDIAVHALSDCQFLDGHTALVMGCVYRVKARGGKKESDWCLKIISQAADGKTVKDLVDEMQKFLEENPVSAPLEGTMEGIETIESTMPPEVPIQE
ncbi:Tellurium resistance protein [Seminavis robusta]|uniref:Tellurium resistance protein n=1 Tax=Seminavis robusta TaxID=568900 RepID=A0A9N8DT33_9STRA|nr:Tellurium resistance protein [Seminavis robusta]|eukprot:Sro258_g101120.1 Tellurium resistance protein (591) ;mRNA; r:42446-44218